MPAHICGKCRNARQIGKPEVRLQNVTCAIEAMSAMHNGPWSQLLLLAMQVKRTDSPAKLIYCIWLWRLTTPFAADLQ